MNVIYKISLIQAFLFFFSAFTLAQAILAIVNNSMLTMTVKVMSGSNNYVSVHERVTIAANSKSTVYFSQSGRYFTKSRKALSERDPIYRKGKYFNVVNDNTGYSEMILTFSIKESSLPQASGGVQISKQEFD